MFLMGLVHTIRGFLGHSPQQCFSNNTIRGVALWPGWFIHNQDHVHAGAQRY